MNSNMYRRMPLLVVGLLAFLALSSSSAFAAGKPALNSYSIGELNAIAVGGQIKPNGASTTYKVEYGLTSALGSSTGETSIGSGDTWVAFNSKVNNLPTDTMYYVRLMAKNSYGTVYSSTQALWTDYWFIGGKKTPGVYPGTYQEAGSFRIKWNQPFGGIDEIACASSGHGTVGNPGGTGDEFWIEPTNCGMYESGKYYCAATLSPIYFNEKLSSSVNIISVSQSNPCWQGEYQEISIVDPLALAIPEWERAVNLPVSLEAGVSYGLHQGTLTVSSAWHLTGANNGLEFGPWGK